MEKISVLIPSFNSEKTIRKTLESVQWADEILIVDSFSQDRTLEICREYTDRILQHSYVNSAAQKNWAIPQCRYPWVLQIDSDEELEPGLAEEIREVLEKTGPETHCYRIPRKNFIYGKWAKRGGMYPDYQTRLFRKDTCCFEDKWVHARIATAGPYGVLKCHLIHQDFKGIRSYLMKFERYMRYELEELLKAHHQVTWIDLFLKPPAVFLDRYVIQAGFLDGFRGLLYASLISWYVFIKYARLWEYQWEKSKEK